MTTNNGRTRTKGIAPSSSIKANPTIWRVGLAATLLMSTAPVIAHADPSLSELAAEIQALKADNLRMKAENREMKAAIADIHGESRRTAAKVRTVAERSPAYALPPPGAPYPVGAVPAFVTADKKLIFGGITITPGGFVAAESVYRSKTTQSDINSAWNNIPFSNSPLSRVGEYRLTGRQSRVALLAEGAITPSMLASGYGEFDFLGAGTTSNATDTNSYAPRIRVLYAGLDMNDYGLHFLAGQMWSLMTLNSKGITPRNEVPPPGIDGQFLPGFVFARQAGIRLTKDFNKKLWISIAAEEAQTTFTGATTCTGAGLTDTTGGAAVTTTSGGNTIVCSATGSGAGFSQYGQPYSLNHLPDIIGKVAYEATFADRDIHIEGMGLYKDLYDASYPTGSTGLLQTHDVAGYGAGGGIIVPVLPRKLDFEATGLAGRGIGRYGAGLLADSTFSPNGSLKPIGEVIGLAGLTLHATPSIDIYAFGGIEREARTLSETAAGAVVGYGAYTGVSNAGCYTTNATCGAQTHNLWQLTGGFWDKLYTGSFGEVRAGAQYSYTERDAFAAQAAAGLPFYAPRAVEHTILTSFRYYPFQASAAPPPVVAKY